MISLIDNDNGKNNMFGCFSMFRKKGCSKFRNGPQNGINFTKFLQGAFSFKSYTSRFFVPTILIKLFFEGRKLAEKPILSKILVKLTTRKYF